MTVSSPSSPALPPSDGARTPDGFSMYALNELINKGGRIEIRVSNNDYNRMVKLVEQELAERHPTVDMFYDVFEVTDKGRALVPAVVAPDVIGDIIAALEAQQASYLTSAGAHEQAFRQTGHVVESSRYWEALHKAKAVDESLALVRQLADGGGR